jgi:3-oxoacyl-(acyl-carrier-protein) synthase/acyl carrier protein
VNETVSGVLGLPVEADEPLMDAGLDSMSSVQLRNKLGSDLGMMLPATLVFDYPSVSALAAYLATLIVPTEGSLSGGESVTDADSVVAEWSSTTAVTITSAMCDGSAGDLSSSVTTQDVADAPGVVSFLRWDIEVNTDDASAHARFGAFMHDVDLWDIQMFSIAKIEALQTDPQQRLLLTNFVSALINGGERLASIKGAHRGVVVGISSMEYASMLGQMQVPITPHTALQGVLSVACGRLSYTFGFSGPSYSVDTACSSSLVSTHLGSRMILTGESDASIAAGAQVFLRSVAFKVLLISNMFSPDGRCKTLDQSADGYVRAEACGVVQLHPSSSEPLHVLVQVCGSAVNQDGRSSSLTAPNGPSQQAVIRRTLETAAVGLDAYELHEMHGTGTPLGDPIEVGAASAVLLDIRKTRGPLVLAAAKSAHGHAEAGAGVLGTVHALACHTHYRTSLLTQLRTVNPYVADTLGLSNSTLAPREASATPTLQVDEPSAGGISSFAFQGTNAHAMMARWEEDSFTQVGRLSWDKQSWWLSPAPHPLITRGVGYTRASGKAAMQTVMRRSTLSYMWDHRVNGRALVPGSGFMEIATAIASALLHNDTSLVPRTFTHVTFQYPLVLVDDFSVGKVLGCFVDVGTSQFKLQQTRLTSPVTHVSGRLLRVRILSQAPQVAQQLQVLLSMANRMWSVVTHARNVLPFKGCVEPGLVNVPGSGYYAHPAAMDNCLQLGWAGVLPDKFDGRTRVPASVGGVTVVGCACNSKAWSMAWPGPAIDASGATLSNYAMQDRTALGKVAVAGMEARVMSSSASSRTPASVARPATDILYTGDWQAAKAPGPAPATQGSSWLRENGRAHV